MTPYSAHRFLTGKLTGLLTGELTGLADRPRPAADRKNLSPVRGGFPVGQGRCTENPKLTDRTDRP
jgi:hypothetical protein